MFLLQVWDADIMEADDFIGEAIIPLSSFDFETEPVHTAWYTLQNEVSVKVKLKRSQGQRKTMNQVLSLDKS